MGWTQYACTPEEMQVKMDDYFDSLIGHIPMTIEKEPVFDESGHQITKEVWVDPPTICGLCDYLGIHKQTFLRWCKEPDERYHDQAQRAKQRIETYLEGKLSTARQADGIKFNLTNNFRESWTDRQELELGPETRRSEALTSISLADKLALIITASEKAKKTMVSHESTDNDQM